MKSVRPPAPLERDVQKAILDYLRTVGVLAWRVNVGAVAATHKGKRRFVRFGVPGQADIMGVLPGGTAIMVEVKRPGKRPTAAQVAFLRQVQAVGACAFWADSVAVVEAVLDAVRRGRRVVVDEGGDQWIEGAP